MYSTILLAQYDEDIKTIKNTICVEKSIELVI